MSTYQNWFLASRPWSFSMSAISVTVGAALASVDGAFDGWFYALTLLGMVIVHAATNLLNDYFDVQAGVDRSDVSTAQYRPHPLLEGKLAPRQVLFVSWVLYALAAAIGAYLIATRGWAVLWLALVGGLASVLYTAPPLKYKYVGLGEFSVFLMWGPLMVEGAYFVQAQTLSWDAFWISLPFGALVALVLLANNIRDIEHDQRQPIRTLAIALGRINALRLYIGLVGLAYLGIVLLMLFGVLSLWALALLFSLPLALRLVGTMARELPTDADAQTAQLDTVFGVLLVLSLILESVFS